MVTEYFKTIIMKLYMLTHLSKQNKLIPDLIK